MSTNGGARPGAGRPKGSRNKVPSKSLQAQAAFAELVLPKLKDYVQVLEDIALDTSAQPTARISAVRELLDRSIGKPREYIELSAEDTAPSVDELLAAWPDEPGPTSDVETAMEQVLKKPRRRKKDGA